ncbi:flagellar hook-basal body complex protein FliE [Xinfangfangia sp. CPCC 101601]|uniref:Flagellar hook-basal body complex protein FliE n=1 Tax=Pseudogemmobacter lacusdianii TaxID=3069608 RepID=A0ABU0VU91_9RHOB|nr:flagellar hook-basal body complex protein FliE [Xinfangfangia sp. CPCC 101601]MDQ2065300.1 flagellar hook-basal body complex protein FliE [Xinfangfangia sp. CPCC 101601]
MDVRSSFAAQTYAQARTAAAPKPVAAESGTVVGQFANTFTEALAKAESTARAAMTGGADPHALVEALASSQLAVETVATVRDRVVEAYQEILRMPI